MNNICVSLELVRITKDKLNMLEFGVTVLSFCKDWLLFICKKSEVKRVGVYSAWQIDVFNIFLFFYLFIYCHCFFESHIIGAENHKVMILVCFFPLIHPFSICSFSASSK